MMAIDRTVVRLLSGAALVALVAGCSDGEAVENDAAAEESRRVVNVEVATVQPETFTDFVSVVGTVEPNRDVTVSAEESGTIRSLLAEKGARVTAGQPLARIDDRVLRAQVQQATAEATLAEETWQRQKTLWEEDGVGSEMAYLQARYRAETAAAAAQGLRERLERTVVRAPIAGVLDDRMVEVGTLVAPGTPVARVIDTGTLKVEGGVPERYAGQIETGTEVDIAVDGMAGPTYTGRVTFAGASVDQGSRTFPIEVAVTNPGPGLKPGMNANVRVARETVSEALVVPQEAVMRVEDGYIVYIAIREGEHWVAEARPVALGPSQGNRVIVDAGLTAGDQVVVVGQNQIARGDRLEVVEAEAGGQ